tara:strand:- start:128 stop:331 length:204 start_codon:yes stop_codon:yes gene_type:complete
MAKKDEQVIDAEIVDEAAKAKEAIEGLKKQLKEFKDRAEYFKTMSLKAEGALEVLIQLHPEKEANDG